MRGLLRGSHGEGVVRVVLTRLAETDAAVVRERLRPAAADALDVLEVGAADPRRHGGEAHLHDLGAEAQCLQDLRPSVARHTGDAHLGHDLEQAGLDGLAVARRRFIANGCERQVRMDRGRSDGDEARDVVHVDDVASDGHDVGGHAPARGQQVGVDGADCQCHGDRQPGTPSPTLPGEWGGRAAIAQRDDT